MRKLGKSWDLRRFNKMIKINITSNGLNRNCVLPDRLHWDEHNITSVIFLPRAKLWILSRGIIRKLKRRDILYNNWPIMLKSIKGHENQEMTKEPSQAKRDRWNTQLNATCDSGLDFFSIKDIQQGDTGKIWIKSKDYVIIIHQG